MLRTTLTSRSSACGRLNSILLVPSLGLAPAGPAQALFKIAPGNFVVSRIASGRRPWRPALVCRPPVRRFQRESGPLHARRFQEPFHSYQNISVKNGMCLSLWPRGVYRCGNDSRTALFPSGERVRVTGAGVICASQDCKFGINISRARPTVVEIDPGDSLPDRGENESGIVATVNGLAGFFVQR